MSKITNRDQTLFCSVLRLIFSCTDFVAHEIESAQQSAIGFSKVDQDDLRVTVKGLRKLGLLAWIIDHTQADGDARV